MSLSVEDLKILREINNNNIKVSDLASKNKMSSRNIRYKIDNLNFYLNKYINKKIEIENGIATISILDDEENNLFTIIDKSILRFSKDERKEIIINMYLFKNSTTLSKIEEVLGVTRVTLNKDIKEINQNIKNRNIRLGVEGKSIALIGNEKKLRHYKSEQLLKYTFIEDKKVKVLEDKLPSTKIVLSLIREYLKSLPIEEIKNSINNIQDLLDVKFGNGFYRMIFSYLTVTIERINSNHIILKKNNEKFLKNLNQYKILKKALKDYIPEEYKYEFLHLTEYFISGYSSKKFVISEFAINTFTQKILDELKKELNINFEKNHSLVEDIAEYLNPAMYRIKNNFTIDEELDFYNMDEGIYRCVNIICRKNNYLLPELLREEEIFYISNLISEFIVYEKSKIISLNDLINIVIKNSKEVDINNLKEDLLNSYKHLLKEDV